MEFMVMRYGSFVLYKPKVEPITYLLWYGPIGFAIFGLFMLMLVIARQKSKRQEKITESELPASDLLNEQEQADIEKLLNR
jgi:cytochrome c-type biogenesis protein CcmH